MGDEQRTFAGAREERRRPEQSWFVAYGRFGRCSIAPSFGHLMGHPDEYAESICPNRNPVNTGTVMDDNTEVVQRLCTPFCDRIMEDTTGS